MKFKALILPLCLLVVVAVGFAVFFLSGEKTQVPDETAVLTYCYAEKNVSAELSAEDSALLKDLLQGKKLYSDTPSCGFTDEISIAFGAQIFCIARDGCAVVKLEGKERYLNLSEEEMKQLHGVFEKYRCTFPCV